MQSSLMLRVVTHPQLMCLRRASRPPRTVAPAFNLTDGAQINITSSQEEFMIGSSSQCDLVLPNVAQQHARIKQKGKQMFCQALVGEEVWDASSTWLNDQELRPGVAYLLGTGAKLAFGDQANSFVITFEEASGSNPLMEMMFKGMAGRASSEVQSQLNL